MGDWIDRLKKQERGQEERARTQEQIRLHDATVIEAKAPVLWQATIECIDADCSRLRRFPDKKRRHCHLDRIDVGFTIINEGPLPRLELYAEFNAAGHCIDLNESHKSDRFQQARERQRAQIEISVNQHEEIEFRYKGKVQTTPESLAQALVSHVCEIADR